MASAYREDSGTARMIERLAGTFRAFVHQETTGAIVLLAATIAALVVANSVFGHAYEEFWHTHAGFFVGGLEFEQSLKHWVDDALMAVFFVVVGLEIKREFIVGELSTLRGAALPVVAAIGGMVVPAAIYFAINKGGPGAAGWGVPMATDIAFALGVLAILGSRIPDGLKIFLTALAIADDIGAILVIALFYTEKVSASWLLLALVPLGLMILMNRLGYEEPIGYLAVAVVLWFCVLNSGIHATIAGVVAAFAIPASARLAPLDFTDFCRLKLDEIEELEVPGAHTLEDYGQQKLALEIRDAALRSAAPLQRLELSLHPFTALVVLPLFALANANIVVGAGEGLGVSGVAIGVFLGLVVGKPLGISLAAWAAVRFGLSDLPRGVTWRHVVGAGLLGGIGFTMSLFVANLAFSDGALMDEAKVAILVASVVAGAAGYLWLRFASRTAPA